MANAGRRAYPHWYTLYEAALLEFDLDKLRQRITEAQHAVMERILVLNGSDGDVLNGSDGASESKALINALIALRDLQKMAESSRST